MELLTRSDSRQPGEEERAFIKAHQHESRKVQWIPPLSLCSAAFMRQFSLEARLWPRGCFIITELIEALP